jgi:hypothetical protein
LVRLPELVEVAIAWAAGAEVVEPLRRVREWDLVIGDFLENLGTWAPDALGIRELLEQTTP